MPSRLDSRRWNKMADIDFQEEPQIGFEPETGSKIDFQEEALPVVQESGVGFGTRAALKNLIDDSPELQIQYLERKGFDARKRKGQLQVKKPGDKQWKVVDPEGFDLQDVTDHIGDVIEGAALAAGTTFGGILGGAAAAGATETVKQGLAKLAGVRKEMDLGEVAESAAIGGAASALGPVVRGASKVASKAKEKLMSGVKRVLGKAGDIAEKVGETVAKTNVGQKSLTVESSLGKAILLANPKVAAAKLGVEAIKRTPKAVKQAATAAVPSIQKRLENLE
jgi:hypothetical protein